MGSTFPGKLAVLAQARDTDAPIGFQSPWQRAWVDAARFAAVLSFATAT